MRTFTKTTTTTEPLLEITREDYSSSPREWSNLGYFITVDRNYSSPDKNECLERIVKETGETAEDQDDHIKLIKKEVDESLDEKVLEIYPVTKYEHSGINYSLGNRNGFDCSNNGFYIITDKTVKEVGTKKEDFEKAIEQELDIYNKYCNGEVYSFVLFDEKGELIDSCGGFYDIEDIKAYLPEDWKDEDLQEYFKD